MTDSETARGTADFAGDDGQSPDVASLSSPSSSSAAVASAALFFRQFLTSPKSVGSIIPTSQTAIDALLDPIDWSRVRTFVEYGPGTGVFTRSILQRGAAELKLIAIDPNPAFIDHLRTHLPDRRLAAVQGSAADVEAILADHGRDHADFILSGLPFSTLPDGLGEQIMAATQRAVTPGGAFLVYQYSLFVLPLLKAHFDAVDVSRVWRCIPPTRLMRAWKKR